MKSFHLKVFGIVLLGFGSCKRGGGIQSYTVDKEVAANPHGEGSPHGKTLPPVPMPAGEGEANPHAGMTVLPAPGFTDVAPAHWLAKKRTAMRMASYEVKSEDGAVADISFTTLRSAPGSLLANINRWREQLGQPVWNDGELEKHSTRVATCFGSAVVVDVQGLLENADPKQDGRIVGAVAEKDGRAWFYKMRGNAELVGREKPHFLAWIETLKPEEEVAALPTPVTPGDLTWSLPEGWTVAFGGQSRYATIEVPAAGAEPTALVVSFFPGDVGGDVANVNRWRGQISLPPVGEADVTSSIQTLSAGDKTMKLVDLKGPGNRMIAAWTRHGENTWFFKWTGPEAALEAGQAGFRSFIGSVRFNSAE